MYLCLPFSLARIVVVKVGSPPILCKTDEIGEICVQSMATGSAYWGLQGKTAHNFRVSRSLPSFGLLLFLDASHANMKSERLGNVIDGGVASL